MLIYQIIEYSHFQIFQYNDCIYCIWSNNVSSHTIIMQAWVSFLVQLCQKSSRNVLFVTFIFILNITLLWHPVKHFQTPLRHFQLSSQSPPSTVLHHNPSYHPFTCVYERFPKQSTQLVSTEYTQQFIHDICEQMTTWSHSKVMLT